MDNIEEAKSMKDVSMWIDEQDGIAWVSLLVLRNAVDADKLGKLVMGRIRSQIDANGLGYFPAGVIEDNPAPRQDQVVRLYRKGPVGIGSLVDAILEPSDEGDQVLRDVAKNTSDDLLNRVRELVCADG